MGTKESKRPQCRFIFNGVRCGQDTEQIGFCPYHLRIMGMAAIWGVPPASLIDHYYNDKVMKGLIVPTWQTHSEAEVVAYCWGKWRGDGRRLDLYVIDDDPRRKG